MNTLNRRLYDATKTAATLRYHADAIEAHSLPPHLRKLARELLQLTKEAYARAHVLRREIREVAK